MEYSHLAGKADVPTDMLEKMLRMAMANHIFCEVDGNKVCHNQFSWKLAKNADFLRGLPFFCDTVMPLMGKMVEKTIEWQRVGETDSVYLNTDPDDFTDFRQFLAEKEKDGYTRLMSLFGSLPPTYSAEVVHGTVEWSCLPSGALVVDVRYLFFIWSAKVVSLGQVTDTCYTYSSIHAAHASGNWPSYTLIFDFMFMLMPTKLMP